MVSKQNEPDADPLAVLVGMVVIGVPVFVWLVILPVIGLLALCGLLK